MRKAISFLGIDFVSTPQLCLKRRPFSTVNYSWLFTTGEKCGLVLLQPTTSANMSGDLKDGSFLFPLSAAFWRLEDILTVPPCGESCGSAYQNFTPAIAGLSVTAAAATRDSPGEPNRVTRGYFYGRWLHKQGRLSRPSGDTTDAYLKKRAAPKSGSRGLVVAPDYPISLRRSDLHHEAVQVGTILHQLFPTTDSRSSQGPAGRVNSPVLEHRS